MTDPGDDRSGGVDLDRGTGSRVVAVGMPVPMLMWPVARRALGRVVAVSLAMMRGTVCERGPGSGDARQERQQQGDHAAGRGSVHAINLAHAVVRASR